MYDIIKEFEGFRSQAYKCSAGKWTIGYGSTLYEDGTPVKQGDTIWNIAKRFRVSMQEIINLNGLENPDRINIGDVLYIMR